jgi:hypothetical protein
MMSCSGEIPLQFKLLIPFHSFHPSFHPSFIHSCIYWPFLTETPFYHYHFHFFLVFLLTLQSTYILLVVFPIIRADILRVANVFFRVPSKVSARYTGKTSNKLFIIRLWKENCYLSIFEQIYWYFYNF